MNLGDGRVGAGLSIGAPRATCGSSNVLIHHLSDPGPVVDPSPALLHAHRSFRVMGSSAHVTVTAHPDDRSESSTKSLDAHLDRAEARLRALESLWSRFVVGSDVCRANASAGGAVTVDAVTVAVVQRSIDAWKQTRGRFDITVLPALLHHGYIRSLNDHDADSRVSSHGSADIPGGDAPRAAMGRTGAVEVDRRRNTIAVPAGAAIDLGGIGKGYAADLVAGELINAGVAGVMVDIGGDIAVRGLPATRERWLLGIENPTNAPHLISSVALVIGGMATSGITTRRWRSPQGVRVHHIIDPATAMPSTTTLLAATVVASDCTTAEVHATAAMMHDAPAAIALLDDAGLAGLLVTRDGVAVRTRSLRSFAP
jgi:thiamine biosynthesis lipoprotein